MQDPINILIVDDEPKNLTVLEAILNDPAYRLVRAESADKALLALVAEEFALLILDIRMPGMTGFELAQIIKDRKKTTRVPIIFLTAYYNEDQHVLTGYDSGAVDYLHKPVSAPILRSKVAVFAELHRTQRECGLANHTLLAEMTERRRAEEQLRVLNETLEQRVAERTEALRESERNYRALTVASSEIAYRMSADWSTMLPLDGRQLMASSDQPLADWAWLDKSLPPDEYPLVRQTISEAIARKTLFELEHRVRRPDGSIGWTRSRAVPILDENEEVIAWFGAASDITDRKQAETELKVSETRYRRLFESAKDGILILDAHAATITDANPFMAEMLGFSQDEFVGKELWQIGLFKDVEASKAAMRELQEKGYIRYEDLPLETKAGRRITVEFVSNVYGEDGEAVIQCNIRDISDRRQVEESLRQRAADLSEADRRKDEFLATLAHELRNPLAPVRMAVEVLRMKGPAIPELQWARDVIDRQTQALTRLIDDLMDVSRINHGKIELQREQVELEKIVQGAVETSRPLIEEMGHELTVTLPPGPVIVNADLTRLAQVMLNLLNNATKYTERGGRIDLRAELQGSDVVVSVTDTGIGIPAEKLLTIFEMFSQVEGALSRSPGGLGIGLCLVKRLVEMHGGSVEAKSGGPGKGSEFVVRLPIAVAQTYPRQGSDDGDKAQPTSDLRILVVDDNRDAAETLAMLLKMMGNNVHTAHDGEEAVAAAREFQPDVVLCDIGLPKLNGYEACRQMKAQAWDKKMILIAVTGWGQDDDRRKSEKAGFDHHLVKPVDPQALITLLAELLPKPV